MGPSTHERRDGWEVPAGNVNRMVGRSPVGTLLGWALVVSAAVVLVVATLVGDNPDDGSVQGHTDGGLAPAEVGRAAVIVDALGCPVDSQGMGAVVDGGLVVTNAHVVAGSTNLEVRSSDGSMHPATLVAFDPRVDLAILEVAGLDVPALAIAGPVGETEASVLARGSTDPGEPIVSVVDGSIRRTINIFISDIYGEGRHERRGLELAVDVDPGDSGAGVTDAHGNLVGVIFSSSRGQEGVSYAISALEVGALVQERGSAAVDAGDCRR